MQPAVSIAAATRALSKTGRQTSKEVEFRLDVPMTQQSSLQHAWVQGPEEPKSQLCVYSVLNSRRQGRGGREEFEKPIGYVCLSQRPSASRDDPIAHPKNPTAVPRVEEQPAPERYVAQPTRFVETMLYVLAVPAAMDTLQVPSPRERNEAKKIT